MKDVHTLIDISYLYFIYLSKYLGGGLWLNGLKSRDRGTSSPSSSKDTFSIPLGVTDTEIQEDKPQNEERRGDDIDESSSPTLLTPPTEVPTKNVPLVSKNRLSSVMPLLPQPIEGYEEKIAALNAGAAVPPEPIMMDGRKRYKETEVYDMMYVHV